MDSDCNIGHSTGFLFTDEKRCKILSELRNLENAGKYLDNIGYWKNLALKLGFGELYEREKYKTAILALKTQKAKDISSKL